MDAHIKTVAIINYISGATKLLGALGLALGVLTADSEPLDAAGWAFLACVVLFAAMFAAANIAGGLGLRKGQRWARSILWTLSIPALVNIPLGTATGGYTIWVLRGTRKPQAT